MVRTRVIPCLLLKDAGLIKTVRFSEFKYVGDPINAIRIFNDKEVDELVFLDISATPQKRKPPFELLKRITSECFMPFGYGGGIRDLEDIAETLNIGAEKVVINSYALENPEFIKKAAERFGSQSIVVSIDARKTSSGDYNVYSGSGKNDTGISVEEWAVKMEKAGAGEIILNSIDRDGTMEGYDIELIKKVSKLVNIPVVALGGAGKLEDFKEAISAGASAVSAGSMFVFVGPYKAVLINYPNVEEIEEILS